MVNHESEAWEIESKKNLWMETPTWKNMGIIRPPTFGVFDHFNAEAPWNGHRSQRRNDKILKFWEIKYQIGNNINKKNKIVKSFF